MTNAFIATDGNGNSDGWSITATLNSNSGTWINFSNGDSTFVQHAGSGVETTDSGSGSWTSPLIATTPEPASWALMATGALALLGLAWRRRAALSERTLNEATWTRPEQRGRALPSSEFRPQPDQRGPHGACALGREQRAGVQKRAAAPQFAAGGRFPAVPWKGFAHGLEHPQHHPPARARA